MGQPNINIEEQAAEHTRQQARLAQAEAIALAHGIKPFNAEEWAIDADIEEQSLEEREKEVDEFLKEVREVRKIPSRKELA